MAYFGVNSQDQRDMKINSSPIISYVCIVEEDFDIRENKIV